MPQVQLANTQCSLLATLCENAAHLPTCDASRHVELTGLADVLRKANRTYEAPIDGPPLSGRKLRR